MTQALRTGQPSGRPAFSACSPGHATTLPGAERLTPRQAQILRLFALGVPVGAVQAVLGISRPTVYHHVSMAYERLGALCREDAYAALGWLRVPEDVA